MIDSLTLSLFSFQGAFLVFIVRFAFIVFAMLS